MLVTGGAGFIGSHLTELLLERGYNVRVLDNLSLGRRDWVPHGAELIQGDIRDLATCRQAVRGCSGVFHAAAMSRSAASLDNVEICTSNNITGTQNVLAAAREASVRKVVYSGSSTAYGNRPAPHTEDLPPDLLNFYGLSKHVGEQYCLMFDRLYGVPAVVLRYFNVYGPRLSGEGAYALVLSIFLDQHRRGLPLTIHGTGGQRRDFIHVRDVARANVLAFERDVRGVVLNVGSGTTISVKEIADRITPHQVFEPRRACDAEITLADLTRTRRELNWQPEITFADGLQELLDGVAKATVAGGR